MLAFAAMPEKLNKVHFYPNYMMDFIHIWVGTIAPDKRADLVVLSQNILEIPPSQLPGIRVDMTLFDGQIVHRLYSESR